MGTSVRVMLIIVMNWVMIGVCVRVVGIIVVLHPFVSVHQLMLIIIKSVIVLLWLKSVILPIVREGTVVISVTLLLVVIKAVIPLEMVWSSMGVEVWHSVVFINNVSVSMAIMVLPRVLWFVMLSVFSSPVPVAPGSFVMSKFPLSPSVFSWSEMAVVVGSLMGVMLSVIQVVMWGFVMLGHFVVLRSPEEVVSIDSMSQFMVGIFVMGWYESHVMLLFVMDWAESVMSSLMRSLVVGIIIVSYLLS